MDNTTDSKSKRVSALRELIMALGDNGTDARVSEALQGALSALDGNPAQQEKKAIKQLLADASSPNAALPASEKSLVKEAETVFERLMTPYLARVEDAGTVMQTLRKRGYTVFNDHVAFRALLGKQALVQIFERLGFDVMPESFYFKEKRLDAVYLKHRHDPKAPRIFISEIRLNELRPDCQKIVLKSLQNAADMILKTWREKHDDFASIPKAQHAEYQRKLTDLNQVVNTAGYKAVYALFADCLLPNLLAMTAADIGDFLNTGLWGIPEWQDFKTLQAESEWASWAIYNQYYLNHFTVAIHRLDDDKLRQDVAAIYKNGTQRPEKDIAEMSPIELLNAMLEAPKTVGGMGLTLNTSGGKIKISPDNGLQQSATVANVVEATFASGETKQVSGSYAEYAWRRVLPKFEALVQRLQTSYDIQRHEIPDLFRRDGFETQNANQIFESTFAEQVAKRDS